MVNTLNKNIADIILSDFRTADVFRMYNIHIGVEGNKPLGMVCKTAHINSNDLLTDLDIATRNISLPSDLKFNEWKIDFLVEYILHIHHAHLYTSLAKIEAQLLESTGEGKNRPEISSIVAVFSPLAQLLVKHNRHEETVIFPYTKQLEVAARHEKTYGSLFVRTLRKPLSLIEKEHGEIKFLLQNLQFTTNDFAIVDTASIQYRILIFKLHELYKDLLQHQYLEEKFLYPKAIAIEQQLLMNESS